MATSNRRVEQLITRYFHQLLHGCENRLCQNVHCASSPQFSHPDLTANQAAILAVQLTQNDAQLCYQSEGDQISTSTASKTEDHKVPATTNLASNREQGEGSSGVQSVRSEQRTEEVASLQATPLSALSSILSSDEQLETPLLTREDMTRLVMLLFSTPNNEDSPMDRSTSNPSTLEAIGSQPGRYTSLQPGQGRIGTHETLISGLNNAARSSPSSWNPFLNHTEPMRPNTSDALRNLLPNTIPNNSLASLVSSLKTEQERESRSNGLTLTELRHSIAIGENQGDWSHLMGLLSTVFSSYEALSASFMNPSTDRTTELGEAKAKRARNIGLELATELMDTQPPPPSSVDVKSWSKRTSALPVSSCPQAVGKMTTTFPSIPLDDSAMEQDSSTVVDDPSDKDEETPTGTTPILPIEPVNVSDVRLAWSLIFAIPERQNVVDTLMRAVRRLVVINLNQLLISQPPESLGDTDAPRSVRFMQQRLINLFFILYECPFTTDPLHFEHLLLNINRAANWLPISLQARLCHIWSETVALPLANCTDPPSPEQSNLCSLQKILMHHTTLRCLTTDHGLPNEDKQICEAAYVLRMVYYASLLAGQLDSPALLEREVLENREFEEVMRSHPMIENRRRQSRVQPAEDPLGKALSVKVDDVRQPFIPAKEFVNETLNDVLQPKQDYLHYRSKDFNQLSFMRLPFLLQTSSKTVLLYYDNRMRMFEEQRGVLLQSPIFNNPELPFLKLHICRDRVVEDALLALEITCLENPNDLKKQLLIEFEGEQGVDEGGLSKEFFQLIIEKVFDPVYGMFIYDEDLRTFWFNPVPLDDLDREYGLIGTLLGLAIYNDIILDVHFPSVIYRKLVGKLGTFEDLEDARPDLYPGLKALLEYDGPNMEEEVGCTFVIAYQDPFGNTLQHELIPNGSSIPVTTANRLEFVERYADFLLNESVKKQFTAFRRGFQMVVDESPMDFLFRPDEVELIVCGSREYDFKQLERVTNYEDYTTDSPVIKNFWHVVHRMTSVQHCRLLQFTTGSDRIPVGGMSKMKFTIARQGADPDRLPTAHTCFNILLLPDYPTLEQLERLLSLAITHCKGFGMS